MRLVPPIGEGGDDWGQTPSSLGDFAQPLNAAAQGGGEVSGFVWRSPAGEEARSDLLVGQVARQLVEPLHIRAGEVLRHVCGALALVTPLHEIAVDAGNELLVLLRKRSDIPAAAL